MNKVLPSQKVITVDIDDTLLMWDLSNYPDEPRVTIECYGYSSTVVVNQKNVNLVEKLAKLGYAIVLWSQTGHEWAEKAGFATGLDPYVKLYMSKPRYYVDDLTSDCWMGPRIWRDPITGDSNFKDEK